MSDERWLWRALALIVAAGAGLGLFLLVQPGGPEVVALVGGAAQVLALPVAILLCFWNGQSLEGLRPAGRDRNWVSLLVGLALLCTLGGDVIDAYFNVVLGRSTPLGFWDDAFFLSGFVLFLAAFWLLPGRRLAASIGARAVLDGSLVVCAVLTGAWPIAIGPIVLSAQPGVWTRLVLVGYPLLSCLGLASLLLVWVQADRRAPRPTLALFTVACLLLGASSTTIVLALLRGSYAPGAVADAGWPVAALLVGLGTAMLRQRLRDAPAGAGRALAVPGKGQEPLGTWRLLLPYALVPVVVLVAYATSRNGADADLTPGVAVGGGLLAALLVVRQIVALLDNHRLARALLADIAERRAVEEQLQHRAFHDPLTALANRALFLDRLEHALTRQSRQAGSVAVLFLDLYRFKVVNDSLGHDAGDLLLIGAAERLKGCVREGDTVARIGGDEFAVLLDALPGPDDAARMAERIIVALDCPFSLGGHDVATAASIGIVTNTTQRHAADLMRDADLALYRAKARGRGRYEIFDPVMNAHALQRLELEADLRRALERDEFAVYYQPKIELATGRFVGMEALVRWHHPRRGVVAPVTFIPLAEETGLIRPLGQWVLEEACRQTRRWREQAPGRVIVTSVNLSPRQFGQPTLVADVARALAASGVDPRSIQLEITESAAMADAESAIATLRQLKGLGVQLAIDDFGTGYSSLAYLKRFPVDTLKIDRSFVTGLQPGSEDASIVKAVVGMAQALHLAVVAEGVETADQREHLAILGCQLGQGYFFATPLPSERAEAFLREWREPSYGPAEVAIALA